MVNVTNENDLFRIVGPGYKDHILNLIKPTLKVRLKGFPLVSVIVLGLMVSACIFAPFLANHDPRGFYIQDVSVKPGPEYKFGTDSLGRDIYSILFYGGRVSLLIGAMGAAIIAIIGVIYGSLSGTASSKIDDFMMRTTEMFGAIPSILLIMILTAVAPASNVFSMSLVIGITGWFGLARIVRTEVRQIRNTEYVLYARYTGDNFFGVLRKHLIPNFISSVMFVVVSGVSMAITTESTLSFLGLGLPTDIPSWGSMLSLANKALITNTWWVIVIPGIFLIVTLVCITNIGNYFRTQNNNKARIF